MKFFITLLGFITFSVPVFAHHAVSTHFDRNDVVEIIGVLTEVKWQNPHVQLTVTMLDEDGREIMWLIDGTSAINQGRQGITEDSYRVGENIRVAGFRGRRNRTAIFASNTLLADGREFITRQSSGPRWSQNLVGSLQSYQALKIARASVTLNSIFRVWSRDDAGPEDGGPTRPLWKDDYPLTDRAQITQANWDRIADNPYLHCRNGMPAIMDSPHPMEIALDGGDVLIRLEELDVVRRVHMGVSPTGEAANPYGNSVGHWEGETFVVTTTDINWPWFDQAGIPQSEELRLVERFVVSEDDRYLNYSAVATDSTIFAGPAVLGKRWMWVPGEEIQPYGCIWERDDL